MEMTNPFGLYMPEDENSKEYKKMLSDLKALWKKSIVVKGPNGELIKDVKLIRYDLYSRAVIRRGRLFRAYLLRSQFIKSISRILLALREMDEYSRPKAEDLAEYICCRIRRTVFTVQQAMVFVAERNELLDHIAGLEKENDRLKACEQSEGKCEHQLEETVIAATEVTDVPEAPDNEVNDEDVVEEQTEVKPTKANKRQKGEKVGKSGDKQEKANMEKDKRKQVKIGASSK